MLQNKKSYFQGTEAPKPKGMQQYKPERAIVVQPRFKESLFHNYDLYETEGVDGPAKHGPGAGFYQNMDEYKSVSDFLEKRRKRNKNKYVSDDSYIESDGTITKSHKKARRMLIMNMIIKQAIDFPVDDQIKSDPISEDAGTYRDSIPGGGLNDKALTQPDFEGKSVDQLNIGRDYTDDDKYVELYKLLDQYLRPAEPHLYGIPDGIDRPEELDANNTISNRNQDYGTTDSGNTLYKDLPI